MEIYAEVKNFSVYPNAIYVNCRVIEKKIGTGHTLQRKFEEVEIGEVIGLKADKGRFLESENGSLEEKIGILLNRFLIFEIDSWEPALACFKKSSPKFTFANLRKCDILQGK